MRKAATPIVLSEAEQETLRSWLRAGTSEQRSVERARIILAAAEGMGTNEIARELGTRPARVSKWRTRFARERLRGLVDEPRPGAPARYDRATETRILAALDDTPPPGHATWTGSLLAAHLGDVSADQVWRTLRRRGISLRRRRSWCISTDPEFAAKAADIVGLYLDPPEDALVLCVDEKPHIQALERAQGWLRLPDGRALTGFAHEYKRHGTTTLLAALTVASGQVQAGHYARRRRREFLDFMDEVVAAHPDTELHVVLDDLSTHKPKHDAWLATHPLVHFHFTPTHASWLNQIEVWFGILERRVLDGASHRSPQEVREAIDLFVAGYNETAAPFEWQKREVHQISLSHHYAELRQ
ncbi:MAG TPA: IS630 family transposase [Candidatus Limnocylindrales bacterium]|nr:IS630 family transposase [Candidatus Limnocylindrales bacterium]